MGNAADARCCASRSDPTENDGVMGLRPNARGPGLVTFGPDRVKEFCEANNLQMIIRAHECVMDGARIASACFDIVRARSVLRSALSRIRDAPGFERFAQGQLITLFSATNYCGTANNAGAILVLGRDLVVYPKLIHPLPPQAALDDSPVLDRGACSARARGRPAFAPPDVADARLPHLLARLARLPIVSQRPPARCGHVDAVHQPGPAADATARPCGARRPAARPQRVLMCNC
jgi:hypothetical protein